MTGGVREEFGPSLSKAVDLRTGCHVRDEILARDLNPKMFKPGSNCIVDKGTLNDPFTAGKVIRFVRGGVFSSAVDIDHLVALAAAWQTGADGWDPTKRRVFANDPTELLAVDPGQNRS